MNSVNRVLLLIVILVLPKQSFAAINTFYDLKLEIQKIKDSVINSPIYGIIIYSGSAIVIFIVAVIVIFILIMLLKK